MLQTSMSEARKNMHEIVNQVCYGGERAIIQNHGKPCVAIISVDDLKVLEHIENIIDIQEAEKALADADKHGTKNFRNFMKEIGLNNGL